MIHYLSEIKENISEQQIIIYKQSIAKKHNYTEFLLFRARVQCHLKLFESQS